MPSLLLFVVVLSLLCFVERTNAFIFNDATVDPASVVAFPGLNDITKSPQQSPLALDISIIVENPNDPQSACMGLSGLELSLEEHSVLTEFPMPGANGLNPQLSSGKKSLKVTQAPKMTDLNGQRDVQLKEECWELVWRQGDMAGNLICGMTVEEEVSRLYYVDIILGRSTYSYCSTLYYNSSDTTQSQWSHLAQGSAIS